MKFEHMVEVEIPEEYELFVNTIRNTCRKNRVAFQLINNRFITDDNGNGEYNGWFSDHHPKRLSVACGQPLKEWMVVLIHESCHMDQWLEKDLTWGNWRKYDDMLDFSDMDEEQLESWCRRTMALEKNCEQRAATKIYNTPVLKDNFDLVEYTKKANSYIVFHRYIMESRKFYDLGREPYNLPEVWEYMPDHFEFDAWNPPERLLDLYREHC